MHKEAREELRVRLKLVVLEHATHSGVTKGCREFNVPRSTFYRWKQKDDKEGRAGLYRERLVAYSHPRRTSPEVVGKILEIRTEYQLGALRIMYYLDRYHGIRRLPKTAPRRALHTKRYAKEVPGHQVQMDVKLLQLKDIQGKTVKRYQYTAVDDATRIRALQLFPEHNQDCAIKFMDYIVEKFPFRISTVRTHRGHEF